MQTAPLAGKVALVTGAGRNIGRSIALALAEAGATVAINVRASRDEGEAVVNDIAARGGDALLVMADITRRAEVDAMIDTMAQRFGRLDILVNNAAVRHEEAFADMAYAAMARRVRCLRRWCVSLHPGSTAAHEERHRRHRHQHRRHDRAHGCRATSPCGCRQGSARRPHARAGARIGRVRDHGQLHRAGHDGHDAQQRERIGGSGASRRVTRHWSGARPSRRNRKRGRVAGQAPAGASSPGRRCTSTAGPIWALDARSDCQRRLSCASPCPTPTTGPM